MKRLRVLAAGAALITAATGLSACDASPIAASVDGRAIKQTALMAELKSWASSPAYVNLIAKNNTDSGITVTGIGGNRNTYDTVWVAGQLSQVIQADIIHRHLAATGALPDQALLAAARAMWEIQDLQLGFWYQLSPGFRQTLVQRLAEQAALSPSAPPSPTVQQVYSQYRPFFYRQICVMQAFGTQTEVFPLSASGNIQGTPTCYDQATGGLEGQSVTYRQAVLGLKQGQTSTPLQTANGYVVVKVLSRTDLPLEGEADQVISTIVAEATGSGAAPIIGRLVSHARVKVNPAYGTWDGARGEVVPPSGPPQSVTPAGA